MFLERFLSLFLLHSFHSFTHSFERVHDLLVARHGHTPFVTSFVSRHFRPDTPDIVVVVRAICKYSHSRLLPPTTHVCIIAHRESESELSSLSVSRIYTRQTALSLAPSNTTSFYEMFSLRFLRPKESFVKRDIIEMRNYTITRRSACPNSPRIHTYVQTNTHIRASALLFSSAFFSLLFIHDRPILTTRVARQPVDAS